MGKHVQVRILLVGFGRASTEASTLGVWALETLDGNAKHAWLFSAADSWGMFRKIYYKIGSRPCTEGLACLDFAVSIEFKSPGCF